jgi:hypothetical protein
MIPEEYKKKKKNFLPSDKKRGKTVNFLPSISCPRRGGTEGFNTKLAFSTIL